MSISLCLVFALMQKSTALNWLACMNDLNKSLIQLFINSIAMSGSIIRCLRRLEEFMRQMVQAAKTIGNEDLEKKFTEGQLLIF